MKKAWIIALQTLQHHGESAYGLLVDTLFRSLQNDQKQEKDKVL